MNEQSMFCCFDRDGAGGKRDGICEDNAPHVGGLAGGYKDKLMAESDLPRKDDAGHVLVGLNDFNYQPKPVGQQRKTQLCGHRFRIDEAHARGDIDTQATGEEAHREKKQRVVTGQGEPEGKQCDAQGDCFRHSSLPFRGKRGVAVRKMNRGCSQALLLPLAACR